jgi:hypothetical protein
MCMGDVYEENQNSVEDDSTYNSYIDVVRCQFSCIYL